MFNQIPDKFYNMDFSSILGFLTLTAILFPIFAVLFLLGQRIIMGRSIGDKYKRRLLGILWRRKNARKKTASKCSYFRFTTTWQIPAIIILGIALAWMEYGAYLANTGEEGTISCYRPYIIDGDTFTCNGTRIRLYSIDAPEMPNHCREGRECVDGDPYEAKDYLTSLTKGLTTCTSIEIDHYGRTIAQCSSEDTQDLSCAMVKAGYAIERYGNLNCP